MISVAAGMADSGMRPFVFSFAAFLCFRAYDQIRICLSQACLPVTLVGSHAGGLAARNGKTHAAPNDLALMLSLPSMDVWAPADFAEVELAVQASLSSQMPCYIRMPRRSFSEADQFPGSSAKIRWLRAARPVTLVSTGLATHWAIEAAEALQSSGHEVGVLHCPCLKPLPCLTKELSGVTQLVVIEDHCVFGGLASLLASELVGSLPIKAFGWPVDYSGKSGSDEELRVHYGLSGVALAKSIAAVCFYEQ
jgi:transketolase